MTIVVATDVVIEFEVAIVIAHVPVPGRRHTVNETAVMKNRQIEPRPIPADQSRRVALDRLEKSADQNRLRIVRLSQGPDSTAIVITKHTAHHSDLVQAKGQEIGTVTFEPRLKRAFDDLFIRQRQ